MYIHSIIILLTRTWPYHCYLLPRDDQGWLALTATVTGAYRWSDGSYPEYSNWKSGSPDTETRCVVSEYYRWIAADCSQDRRTLCESRNGQFQYATYYLASTITVLSVTCCGLTQVDILHQCPTHCYVGLTL